RDLDLFNAIKLPEAEAPVSWGPSFTLFHYSVFNDRCAKLADPKSVLASIVAESGKLVDPAHHVNPIFYFLFARR
ncbi:hypothetical protein, partial [Thiovibrio frasassiensis]